MTATIPSHHLVATAAQVHVTDTLITVHTRQPARRVCTAFLVVMTLAFAGVITSCGGNSVALPKPLSDALTIMQESGGYSFTATITTGASSVTTTGDFQAPNRIAQTVTRSGSTPVAMVLDGATVHVQDPATGMWSTKASNTESAVDLRSTFAALGSPTSMKESENSYTFKLSDNATKQLAGSDATGSATVTATVGTVGLSQLQYTVTVNGQAVTVTIDYRNVGNSPKVVVPV